MKKKTVGRDEKSELIGIAIEIKKFLVIFTRS